MVNGKMGKTDWIAFQWWINKQRNGQPETWALHTPHPHPRTHIKEKAFLTNPIIWFRTGYNKMLNFKTLENGYEIIIIITIVVLVAVVCSGFGCQNIKWIVIHEIRLIWNVNSFNMPIASYCVIYTHGRADNRCIALHRHRLNNNAKWENGPN